MALIAITREMGSCGAEIAARLANALTIPVVHQEIPELVESHWGEEKAKLLDPKAILPTGSKWLCSWSDRAVAFISAEILSIATTGSAVFRGWGAAQLFSKVPHALRVRIGAPFKVRLARMQEKTNWDRRTVERFLRENDAIRGRLVQVYYGRDWRDPDEYDLEINTGQLSVDDAVEEILTLARRPNFQEEPETTRILNAMRLEALARATLFANPATRDCRIHVRVSGDEMMLGGIVNDGSQREEVIRTLAGISPDISITSRLRIPTDYRARASCI
jgi:Cytidylate kinase-like family